MIFFSTELILDGEMSSLDLNSYMELQSDIVEQIKGGGSPIVTHLARWLKFVLYLIKNFSLI